MKEWALSNNDIQALKGKLIETQKNLNEMLGYKNTQALLKQLLSKLKIEFEYFNEYYSENNSDRLKFHSFFRLSADNILNIMLEYLHNIELCNEYILP
jgi:cystathionine beta-lyase/cystathionine gamma-synthase